MACTIVEVKNENNIVINQYFHIFHELPIKIINFHTNFVKYILSYVFTNFYIVLGKLCHFYGFL